MRMSWRLLFLQSVFGDFRMSFVMNYGGYYNGNSSLVYVKMNIIRKVLCLSNAYFFISYRVGSGYSYNQLLFQQLWQTQPLVLLFVPGTIF
jgi:hypothetical protein